MGIGDDPPGAGNAVHVALDSSVDAPVVCGGFPWAAGKCDACMQGCCSEATACRGDGICASGFDCIGECAGSDDACRSACVTYVDDPLLALWSCQARSCESACGLECGGVFTFTPSLPGSCTACLKQPTACSLLTSLAACPECLNLQVCLAACGFDLVCQRNCFQTHPSVTAPDAGVLGWTGEGEGICPPACPTGTDWSCLGHVTWPLSTSSMVTFTLHPVDYQDGALVPGATVKACEIGSADCIPPLATSTLDDSGDPTLTLPSPFTGYFDIEATSYVTELLFIYPSVVESLAPGAVWQEGLIQSSQYPGLALAAGASLQTSLGVVYSTVTDCDGYYAPGISFSSTDLGPSASPFYEVNGTPSGRAKVTSYGPGNLVGGGFINVSPGLVHITASLDGKAVSIVSARVRAGAFTSILQVPTP